MKNWNIWEKSWEIPLEMKVIDESYRWKLELSWENSGESSRN